MLVDIINCKEYKHFTTPVHSLAQHIYTTNTITIYTASALLNQCTSVVQLSSIWPKCIPFPNSMTVDKMSATKMFLHSNWPDKYKYLVHC